MSLKVTLFGALLFLGATLQVGGAEPLTASELAAHLHVATWISKIDLGGKRVRVDVVHVKDGAVQTILLSNELIPTNRPFERLVILASQTPLGTKVSIHPGSSGAVAASLTEPGDLVPYSMTRGLPDTVVASDYLLAYRDLENEVQTPGPIRLRDIKEGLVFRLHAKE